MWLKISLVEGEQCTVRREIVRVKRIWRYDCFLDLIDVIWGSERNKWETWKGNRYENDSWSVVWASWKRNRRALINSIISICSCRILHPIGCYQIQFTYLFNGELNSDFYKDIWGPDSLCFIIEIDQDLGFFLKKVIKFVVEI